MSKTKKPKKKPMGYSVFHWDGYKVIFNAFPSLCDHLHAAMYDTKNTLKWICFDPAILRKIQKEGTQEIVVA